MNVIMLAIIRSLQNRQLHEAPAGDKRREALLMSCVAVLTVCLVAVLLGGC